MDLGADRRGVDMGPSAVRVANLNERLESLGYEVTDAGNISVRNPEMLAITDRKLKYLPEIAEAMNYHMSNKAESPVLVVLNTFILADQR